MTIDKLMVLVALAASLVLVTQASARLFPIIAAVTAALETLLVFRIITFSISGVNVFLVLAIALVVAGGVSWAQTDSKNTVTAATAVTLIGAIQLAAALHVGGG
jgi:hypothetical protein